MVSSRKRACRRLVSLAALASILLSSTAVASAAPLADQGTPTPGTVAVWGRNDLGQLGTGNFGPHTHAFTAVQLTQLHAVIAVSGGHEHSLALGVDGSVWAWGDNEFGQLGASSSDLCAMFGLGSNPCSTTPIQVAGLHDVVAIDGGGWHSLAITSDGRVWAWGRDELGQVGAPSSATCDLPEGLHYPCVPIPTPVVGIANAVALAAGENHSLVLKSDGTVWAWGYNGYGQLGDDTLNTSSVPVQVVGLSGVTAIAAGNEHSLALKSDGTVWAWGNNSFGQRGDGTDPPCLFLPCAATRPVQVVGLSGVVAIGAGWFHSLAVAAGGQVWAWGWDMFGQLGDGRSGGQHTQSIVPVKVKNLANVVAVSGGQYHSQALKQDGTLWTWGKNLYGALDNGTNVDSNVPVQAKGLVGPVAAMDAGGTHGLALDYPWIRAEESSDQIHFLGLWKTRFDQQASGWVVEYSTDMTTPASASFSWTGTGVRLIVTTGPALGKALASVDGGPATMLDLYSADRHFRQALYLKQGLAYGEHTVTLTAAGTKNKASQGTTIDLDAVDSR